MLRADAHLPLELRRIGAEIHDRAALVHVDAGPHEGITVPEQLLVGTVEHVLPQAHSGSV